MRKSLTLFFSLFLLSFAGFSQIDEIEFEEYKLDNGLHVILYENHSTPIVKVQVSYHVGSKDEDPERTGFAHFFEHLMFEGSENIGRGKFFEYVQNAGGKNNAYTSFDETVYFEILPSNQLELGLWLESERMMHAKIDKEGVETQRAVVKEERNQRLDNQPYGSLLEETFSHAYKTHPYRWTPIGSDQYIDQATLDEFMAFYEKYYVPNNAVLVVAGDIDKSNTKKMIEDYFGPIEKGSKKIERPDVVEPKQKTETRDTVYDNIQLPALVQAYHTPKQGTDEYYALNMLRTLLSDGKSSRLYRRLVEEEEKALQVSSSNFALEDPGLFLTFGISNMGVDIASVEKLMNEEIEKVQNELISTIEFEKLQNQIENDYYNGISSINGVSSQLAKYYLFFGNTDLINTEMENYRQVTRKDLQNAAQKYLVPENRTVLYYLPKSEEEK